MPTIALKNGNVMIVLEKKWEESTQFNAS
jgi:hypothetical protein